MPVCRAGSIMFAAAIRGGCAGISSARTGSVPGIPAKPKSRAAHPPREIKAGRWRARSESEDSEIRDRSQQNPELLRRDDPHNPKTVEVVPGAGIDEVAVGRERVELIVVPRAAAHHPGHICSAKIFSSVACPIGICLVGAAGPRIDVPRKIEDALRRGISENTHRDCPPDVALKRVAPL